MLGQRARYAIVQLPGGMWTTDQWCIETGNVFKPSGSQWLLIQYGWSYESRFKWSNRAAGGPFWREIKHTSVPNIDAQPNNGRRPALVSQYGCLLEDEVLNTAVNPITNQPEINFTKLADGQECWIAQTKAFSAHVKKTFYSIVDNGGEITGSGRATVTKSENWVAVMTNGVPVFVQQNP